MYVIVDYISSEYLYSFKVSVRLEQQLLNVAAASRNNTQGREKGSGIYHLDFLPFLGLLANFLVLFDGVVYTHLLQLLLQLYDPLLFKKSRESLLLCLSLRLLLFFDVLQRPYLENRREFADFKHLIFYIIYEVPLLKDEWNLSKMLVHLSQCLNLNQKLIPSICHSLGIFVDLVNICLVNFVFRISLHQILKLNCM